MEKGLIILIVVVAAIIGYLFGFKILLWCIGLGLFIFLLVVIYELMDTEGKTKGIKKLPKNTWNKYKKTETKIFKWFDNL